MSESTFIASANFTKNIGVLKPFPYNLFDTFDGAYYTPWDKSTLFQDAAMSVPVTADGQLVRVMLDASGNGYHFVAPSDDRRPVYREAAGISRLEFVDKGMALSGDALGMFSGVSKVLVCMGLSLDAINTFRTVFRMNTNSNDARLSIGTGASAAEISVTSRRNTGEASAVAAIAKVSGAHVYSASADFAAGSNAIRRNRNAAAAAGSGMVAGVTSGGAANGGFLANYNNTGSTFAAMSFYGGIVIAGDASVEDVRMNIETIIAGKCGATLVA